MIPIRSGVKTGFVIYRTGLEYNTRFSTKVSKTYSDLCLDCGEIVRTYIKGETDRNWCKDKK
ncbi:TPA: hypothetical protein KN211_001210 [Clostridioides difficile]|uniref:hypothetical protein n=1 Tax=Clostridioides difficile TaxID=1496 RepID=UPI000D1ED9C8|nr:hypothetical protein [Clostridioides difficile]VHX62601.1 Uncharacterised protein [Clostridioides difficile]VIB75365.1 Uncharacterised protein [Clostridioides difficile]HBF2562754.1 hypothetical protein [Clostridioides difficile]